MAAWRIGGWGKGKDGRGNGLARLWAGAGLAALFATLVPVLAGFVIAVFLSGTAPMERLRNIVFDQYLRAAPRDWTPDLPVRIVDIDDESLARLGQWPWPRRLIAELTDRLAEAGAAVVAYDILFAEPDRYAPAAIIAELPASPERDALRERLERDGALAGDPLARAFAQAPVVAATALTPRAGATEGAAKVNFVLLGDDPSTLPPRFAGVILPLPELREAAAGLGAINYLTDSDQIIRKAPLALALIHGERIVLVPSFAGEALRVAFQTDTPIIKATNASGEASFGGHSAIVAIRIGDAEIATDADGSVRIRFAGPQPGRRIPAWKALAGEVDRDEIEGRIILVGTSAAALGDIRATPLAAATPGVEIHAELLEHALTGARLTRPDWAPGAEGFAILLGGLLVAFATRRLRPSASALAVAGLLAAGFAGSWFAFTRGDMLLDPLAPGAAWFVAYVAGTLVAYRRSERERRQVRSAFQRYVAPAVVERIAADPSRLRLGGETRETTVLFSDVRDFTSRAEKLDAEGVVRLLNALHTPLTAAVLAQGGTVDKYMGDGLMAFWNAPLDAPDHAERACAAALAMQEAVAALDARMAEDARASGREHQPLRIGVGLKTGSAFVGNMGSEQRFDYSMVGDTVNVAARLEAATKTLGAPILVSAETVRQAPGFLFTPMGEVALKGKSQKEEVFALHARKLSQNDDFEEFLRLHNEALNAVLQGRADARERIRDARAHPQGARYEAFYAHGLQGDAPEAPDTGKKPGGS